MSTDLNEEREEIREENKKLWDITFIIKFIINLFK